MRNFRTRMRGRRFLLVGAVVAAVVVGGSAIAYAAYPTDSVAVMTACLTTSGTGAGNIVNVAMGANPAKACGSNQKLVHISGGTITQVTAGAGLGTTGSGGTDTGGSPNSINNGWVTLGLLPGFALPQNCSAGQFPDWGSVSGTWGCATDQNTTYGNGTGLELNANVFSVNSSYRLPQNCDSGQFPSSNGAGQGFGCGTDKTYSGADFATSGQDCPAGQFATGINAGGHLKCAQPTADDLQGSTCTFAGRASTLDVSTDNTTGAVSMTCRPLFELSAEINGGSMTLVNLLDSTAGSSDFFNPAT